ncbi:putative pentatricopeptide repeat-containing protein At1g12700, mitochondrial [Durio zibethinus]|uniref:Pentatricopeptide repeat-containing protein At1g12700, mitochondrial n=1 Tax=Durio zibethinus TaxID=66656 RepID=A0A6P5WFB1_DURZI|nr:putative pentatricopeptide repeat-containing protein At1g12700, mitochondrial [Durio zibethinus]
MEKKGFQPDVIAYNIVLDSFCKDRLPTEALMLFSEMRGRGIQTDFITYNSLIHGMCNLGQLKEVARLMVQMVATNITPNIVTYNLLVSACRKEGNVSKAKDTVEIMRRKRVKQNIITYNLRYHQGYYLQRKMEEARKVFEVMIDEDYAPDSCINTIIIKGYCKLKSLNELKLDAQSYIVVIKGLSSEAFDLHRKMEDDGCLPNSCFYSTMIRGFLANNNASMKIHVQYHLNSLQFPSIRPTCDHEQVVFAKN